MNTLTRSACTGIVLATVVLASLPAQAQVIVHGTRQIFPGDQREISVRTENTGKRAALVQAWIDDGDKQATPESSNTPFVLRPPVYRLDPGKTQVMRVLFTGAELPKDRESIYWLNVLDIPPTPKADEITSGNYLQFSLRTRTKLIYRPKGLPGDAVNAAQKVQWRIVQDDGRWMLEATNPSPYYVHFMSLGLRVQGLDHPADEVKMVAPMSSQRYVLQGVSQRPSGGNVQFQYLNDQGGVAAQSVPLTAP